MQLQIVHTETEFKIHANLSVENSTFLVNKLFGLVNDKKIIFEIKSKPGSVYSEITIGVISGVLSEIVYDLCKNLHNKLKQSKEEKDKIDVFTEEKHYEISGEKNDSLPS